MHLGFSLSENACIVVLQIVTRLFLGQNFNINSSLQFYVELLHVKLLRVKVLIRGSQFQQLRIFTIHGNFGVNIAILSVVVQEKRIFMIYTLLYCFKIISPLKWHGFLFLQLRIHFP